jgi:hypothetical protein
LIALAAENLAARRMRAAGIDKSLSSRLKNSALIVGTKLVLLSNWWLTRSAEVMVSENGL